jgi:hypothetical protein
LNILGLTARIGILLDLIHRHSIGCRAGADSYSGNCLLLFIKK